ncbi:MAG: NUDIX domain-containing protein [Gammaproteobacteria bacterium]|nr:NUDIX domain-containing protein [Gammaproteobacteria bacterium]
MLQYIPLANAGAVLRKAKKLRGEFVQQNDQPRVGVAVIVLRQGKVLLGRRMKMPGRNTWQCPGGYMQQGESVFESARREVAEASGLVIHNLNYGPYTNNRFTNGGLHTVTLYVVADYMGGEAIVKEPNEIECWQWVDINEMPQPLFLPLQKLMDKHGDWFTALGQ